MSVSGYSLDLLCWCRSGGPVVIQLPRCTFTGFGRAGSGLAGLAVRGPLVAALAAALALAGCGRKAGLDAPPMAAAGDYQSGQPGAAPATGPDGKPVAAQTEKRKTILDWLID
jgi:predicted small lipoprotein YifL